MLILLIYRVTEVDPKVLAATLTLMDHQLFCNITMQEFLSNNNPITSLNSKQVVLFAKQFTALVQRTDKVRTKQKKSKFHTSRINQVPHYRFAIGFLKKFLMLVKAKIKQRRSNISLKWRRYALTD